MTAGWANGKKGHRGPPSRGGRRLTGEYGTLWASRLQRSSSGRWTSATRRTWAKPVVDFCAPSPNNGNDLRPPGIADGFGPDLPVLQLASPTPDRCRPNRLPAVRRVGHCTTIASTVVDC